MKTRSWIVGRIMVVLALLLIGTLAGGQAEAGSKIYLPIILKNWGGCTAVPTLIGPPNGSRLNTLAPLFEWDSGDVPNATRLRGQIARDSAFAQVVLSFSASPRGVGQQRFSTNFDPATTYYWRTHLMCGDLQGPYSPVWSFTTGSGGTIPPAPALTAPISGTLVASTTVTLQWAPVGGALEYLVRWRTVGEAGYSYAWIGAQSIVLRLSPNTTYEWWVSARSEYAIGTDSPKWRFRTPATSFVALQERAEGITKEEWSVEGAVWFGAQKE